jgi:SPW repeat-containing protein
MILKSDYREPAESPHVTDRLMAARFTSAITAMAGFWYFISPILYFGASEQPNGLNEWVVGGLVLLLSSSRLLFPARSTAASWINAGIGVWILVSPWACGFSDYTSRTVNSLVIGSIVVGFSLFSGSFTRRLYAPVTGDDLINA